MAEISDAELTTIENTFVKMREAIADDTSPEATALKEQIVESEQIVSSKLDQSKPAQGDSVSGPTGGALYGMEDEDMMMGADESTIALDDFKEIGAHLQEALNIIQKALKPAAPPSPVPPKEAIP